MPAFHTAAGMPAVHDIRCTPIEALIPVGIIAGRQHSRYGNMVTLIGVFSGFYLAALVVFHVNE
jgi:hypothetical protein